MALKCKAHQVLFKTTDTCKFVFSKVKNNPHYHEPSEPTCYISCSYSKRAAILFFSIWCQQGDGTNSANILTSAQVEVLLMEAECLQNTPANHRRAVLALRTVINVTFTPLLPPRSAFSLTGSRLLFHATWLCGCRESRQITTLEMHGLLEVQEL